MEKKKKTNLQELKMNKISHGPKLKKHQLTGTKIKKLTYKDKNKKYLSIFLIIVVIVISIVNENITKLRSY